MFEQSSENDTIEDANMTIYSRMYPTNPNSDQTWTSVVHTCLITFAFSYIILILFRYAVKSIIRIIMIGFNVSLVLVTIVSWTMYFWESNNLSMDMPFYQLLTTLITIVSVIMSIWQSRKINLVSTIFIEASNTLIDIPLLLIEPILTFACVLLVLDFSMVFYDIISNAKRFVEAIGIDGQFQVELEPVLIAPFAKMLTFLGIAWVLQLIYGCQNFVISGTISKWYFAKDKGKLNSPILCTFADLLRYHMGSICLGSILITIVTVIKLIAYVFLVGFFQISVLVSHFFLHFKILYLNSS